MSTPNSTTPDAGPALSREEESLDLRDYLRPIWQRKWIILLIVVLAAGGTYAVESLRHHAKPVPLYVSTTQVYIENADPGSSIGPSATPATLPDGQQMSDLAHLFTDAANTEAVYARLGLPLGSAGSVNVAPLSTAGFTGTSIMVVTATSRSAALAARLANAYVDVFLAAQSATYTAAAQQQARTLKSEIAGLGSGTSARQSLEVQLDALRADARNPNPGATQLSKAPVPTAAEPTPAPRSKIVDAAIGAVVGLILAVGIALALSLLDRRLTRVSAIEERYGRPILAVLPHVGNPSPPLRGHAPAIPSELIEALRALRINLRLTNGTTPPRTILVTSAMPGEGKSTLARNLALVHADGGDRVLLIDADLRRPSLPQLFDVDPERGLTHVLRGESWAVDTVVPVLASDQPGPATNATNGGWKGGEAPFDPQGPPGSLDVLCHGELLDNPVTLLASDAMASLVTAARGQYDVVIIDSAPILAVTDTVPLLSLVDAVILVARVGVATRDSAARLSETLARVRGVKVAGVVANDLRDTFLDTSYGGMYSGRYGGYGYRDRSRARKLTAKAG